MDAPHPKSYCYWARLRGVSGDVDEIIANEHAIGPSSVTVQATDFALETECWLTLQE